ncbi:MAG: hypothetical protein ACT4RN_06275 [Pseudonocardia sp.]
MGLAPLQVGGHRLLVEGDPVPAPGELLTVGSRPKHTTRCHTGGRSRHWPACRSKYRSGIATEKVTTAVPPALWLSLIELLRLVLPWMVISFMVVS